MAQLNEQLARGTSGPNAAQRAYWEGEGLQLWTLEGERWEEMLRPFGVAMLDAAGLLPGERVLDVGCGWGGPTLAAAERVAPDGLVVGVDLSPSMLAVARQRAAASGIDNVELLDGDAQVHPFATDAFDVVISRFGTMFFENPAEAFANLARALRPGGRLASLCWQEPLKTEWAAVSIGAAAPHVGLPDFGPPGAPGPFALADGDRLRAVVQAGGFGDVRLQAVTRPQRVGDDVDDVIGFITSLPETVQMFAGKPESKVAAAVDAVRAAITPYAGPEGVTMDATAWLVTAGR